MQSDFPVVDPRCYLRLEYAHPISGHHGGREDVRITEAVLAKHAAEIRDASVELVGSKPICLIQNEQCHVFMRRHRSYVS